MNKTLKSDLLLFAATFIWGVTFLVQKNVTDIVGPFTFTAARFLLGGLFLLPLALRFNPLAKIHYSSIKKLFLYLLPAIILGPILVGAAALQQWGLVYTSEENSGFITTFYVIFTPIIAYFMGNAVQKNIWFAAVLMFIGLYFLSFGGQSYGRDAGHGFMINLGDLLTLICAVFWAIHVIALGIVTQKIPPLWIAVTQNISCAFFAIVIAFLAKESPSISQFSTIIPQTLWAGVISVGIAYTFQVLGQQHAPPIHAVIILSLEAVVAAVAAMLFYKQLMSPMAIFGASLMLLAVMVAEVFPLLSKKLKRAKA